MNKNKKYGIGLTLFSLLLIAIIIVVNYGVDMLAERYPLKADLTRNGIYKLSDYTKNLLHDLDKDVSVYAFYSESGKNDQILEILYRYQRESSHIQLQVVSPEENPALSLKYDESNQGLNEGTIIFDCDGKFTTVTENDMSNYSAYLGYETELYAEEKFTESIVYVTSDVVKKVYTVTGHGEDNGYEMRNVLSQYGYSKTEISLADGIPSDASLLMILAPVRDFSEADISVLDTYLKQGGGLFIAYEPSAKGLDTLNGYLSEWGIEATDEFALEGDANRIAFNTSLMFYATGSTHPISSGIFSNNYLVLVSNTKPVYPKEVSGVTSRAIMTTSEKGYVVSADDVENGKPELKGAVPIAATAEKDDGKIAVFGSDLYFVDALFNEADLANKELFLNSLDWLSGSAVNTGIRPKSLDASVLTMTKAQSNTVIGIVIAIPLIIIAFGVYVWIRRRHK